MDKSQGKCIKYQLHHLPGQTRPGRSAICFRPFFAILKIREVQPAWQPMATSPATYGNLWIGFRGKFTGKPHIKNGKIDGFRLRFSPTNQSIEWLVHLQVHWCTNGHHGAPWCPTPQTAIRNRLGAREFLQGLHPEHRTRTRSQISPEPWLPSIRIIRYQITNKMMNMMMIFFNSTMIYYDYDIIKCFAAQILSKDVHPPKTTSNPHQPSHHARNQLVPVVAGLRMAGNPKSSRSAIFRSQSWCKRATAQRRNFPDSFLREAAHLHKLRKKWMKL